MSINKKNKLQLKNLTGLTLMETMLVVTISLSVLSLAIYWLGIYQKSKAASVVAYDVVEVVTAIDRRIFIDGYDSSKWGTLKYSNNNDVRKFLNEKLISSEAPCGLANGWKPVTDKFTDAAEIAKMEKSSLIQCNLWSEKTPWNALTEVEVVEFDNKVTSVNLYIKQKNDAIFEENFNYLRQAVTEMKEKDSKKIAGLHYYSFVNDVDKNTPISALQCSKLKSKCLIKASFSSESTGSESLLVNGNNSMINSAITFKPDRDSPSLNCLRWKFDETGSYSSSDVKCGIGVYDTSSTEQNKKIDVVINSMTSKAMYLDKTCNQYEYNYSNQTLEITGSSPCGIYEADGSVIQAVQKMYTRNLIAQKIKARDLFVSSLDVKEALTIMETVTARGDVKVDGKTTINQGLTVDKGAKFNENLEIKKTLNVYGNTNVQAIAAENMYSAHNMTAKTFKGDYLELNVTKNINSACDASEAGTMTATTLATNADFKNTLLICRATAKNPSDFRWRSLNGLEGQIMSFNSECPPGWKRFEAAAGRTLIGTGRYVEGANVYNYNLGDQGGEAMHMLTIDEMPTHQHDSHTPSGSCPSGNCQVAGIQTTHTDTVWSSNSNIRTSSTGGNKAHENRSPYIAVNWCIFET
jgi:hypothetical protein